MACIRQLQSGDGEAIVGSPVEILHKPGQVGIDVVDGRHRPMVAVSMRDRTPPPLPGRAPRLTRPPRRPRAVERSCPSAQIAAA